MEYLPYKIDIMNPILKNILALILGIIIGSVVNMALIKISSFIIPLPEGVNPEDIESIKANIHLYTPLHFIMPFLAHAIGTLAGALVAVAIAANHKMKFAIAIGSVFLLGGIMMAFILPESPTWFIALDLIVAYIPMGYLATKILKT